jgi:hypothetical protein
MEGLVEANYILIKLTNELDLQMTRFTNDSDLQTNQPSNKPDLQTTRFANKLDLQTSEAYITGGRPDLQAARAVAQSSVRRAARAVLRLFHL